MQKTILITGSTDGIGLEAARMLVSQGHRVLLHGRNPAKLAEVERTLSSLPGDGCVESYVSDLSLLPDVEAFAKKVADQHARLDVLINNAGVFHTSTPITDDGLDVRFAVNTLAPYILTQTLLPSIGAAGRVVNVSSAGQAPVDPDALAGRTRIVDDYNAYSQSKLALTMWSRGLAHSLGDGGPMIVAVNPGSKLGSKMVKEAFGIDGRDISIGGDILMRAALSDEFASATGLYFDNDSGRFADPHPDALNSQKVEAIMRQVESMCSFPDPQRPG